MKTGWETEKLGNVCSFLNRGISPKYTEQNGICVLNQKCVRDHVVNYELARRHNNRLKVVAPDRYIQLGDVLVNSTGTGTLGRVAQIREKPSEPTTVDSHLTIVRPKPNKFLPEFFGYMLIFIEDEIKEAGEGCGGQTELARTALAEKFTVNYPTSISEQQRIVAILDETFAGITIAIANAKKNLTNVREIFDSEVQSILTNRGKGWVDKTLNEVCVVERGSSPRPIKEFFTNSSDGVNWIKISDTEEGGKYVYSTAQKITKEGAKQSRFVKEGDFILTNSMSFGRPYIMKTSGYIHDGWFVLRLNTSIDTDYFYYLLSSEFVQSQFFELASGSVVKNISGDLVKKAILPIPPLDQQRIIVGKLLDLSNEIEKLQAIYQNKLTALDELRKSLLHKAFNGELLNAANNSNIISFPHTVPNITTTDLHAGILAIAYQQHEGTKHQNTFHHIKAEKISHMVESYVGIDLGRTPIKDAAGPNDYPHLRKVEHRAEKAGFFSFTEQKSGGYLFRRKNKFNSLIKKTTDVLGEQYDAIIKLIHLMLPMDKTKAEIFATVYAAWNNLILESKPISDEAIVYEARENWHEAKLNIPRERFFKAIEWMKENNIAPKGMGKFVGKAST